jgi:STE24 endopeptidase
VIEDLIEELKHNKKIIYFIVNALIAGLFVFIMAFGFSRPLRDFINLFTGNTIILITIYFFLFYTLYFVFSFPFKYYQGLEYIKANNFMDWARGLIKKEMSAFFILFFLVQVIYFFLETDVGWWWLPVAILCIIARYCLELAPKYLAPLFLPATALDPSDFKQRLVELVVRADIKVTNVFFVANAKAEVAILNQGPGCKLMLSDKIRQYAHEEVEILVARETAYHYKGFLYRKLIIEALITLLSFFIVNISFKPVADYFGFEFLFDIETLPVLLGLFFIVFLLMSFIQNSYFRSMDKQADIYALEMTQAPDAFISLLIRQQENRNKRDIDDFINQVLNGNISEASRMSLAQDYAQEIYLKEKGSKTP